MVDFGAETTAATVVSHFADQTRGKTFLINGVSPRAIGAEIAVSLAEASPLMLILICNSTDDASGLRPVLEEITRRDASIVVTILTTNPASLSSVRSLGQDILIDPSVSQIDVVINIPTEMPRPYNITEDGIEYLLHTNYLSQFLLTTTILPKVLLAERSRVINISSSANKIAGMRWHDLSFEEPGSYDPWTAYGQTKTAAILFTVALNAKIVSVQRPSFRSYAVHPGGVKTKLQETLSEDSLRKAFEGTKKRFGEETANEFFRWKTLSVASSTPLRAALDPFLVNQNGIWLEDCNILEESVHLDARATDLQSAQRLWDMSEELSKEKP
ncbi:short-chain dehydrogenase [Colletotrichum nymphaeae SA-01]|uniref:Short-chain dehydrogenase n=1 Tax=Colletotrichum nymphaeae SA-01 TaxID=1460502 RepID=A0A135U9I4_9PEZI|nr:short-chain dehydrogenase [Colletotrichum nymphaeae SA-01]